MLTGMVNTNTLHCQNLTLKCTDESRMSFSSTQKQLNGNGPLSFDGKIIQPPVNCNHCLGHLENKYYQLYTQHPQEEDV